MSLLRSHNHDVDWYPVWMVFSEAERIERRFNRETAMHAQMTQMAVSATQAEEGYRAFVEALELLRE